MATRIVKIAASGSVPGLVINNFGGNAEQFVDSPYTDYDTTVANLETLAADRGFAVDNDWLKAALQDAHRGYDTARNDGKTVAEAQAAAVADGDASQAMTDGA